MASVPRTSYRTRDHGRYQIGEVHARSWMIEVNNHFNL